jgi:hypothetical protein
LSGYLTRDTPGIVHVARPSSVTPDQKRAILAARDAIPPVKYDDLAADLRLPRGTVRYWVATLKPTTRWVQPNNRQCMTCRAPFHSEGAHHRMCERCRDRSVSPFAPDDGQGVPDETEDFPGGMPVVTRRAVSTR